MKIGTHTSTQTSTQTGTGQNNVTICKIETYQIGWRKSSTQTSTQKGTLKGTPLVH